MNLFVFFVIWMFVFAVPIPPSRKRAKSPARVVIFILGLLIFLVFSALFMPLSLFVYWLVYTRIFLAFLEYAFTIKRPQEDEGYASPRRRIRVLFRAGKVLALLFVLYLIFCLVGIAFSQIQRVSNAYYFNSFIKLKTGLPFNKTIPDGMVRLVTKELAVSVARRHMSEFGSNMRVLDTHITKTLDGHLVWVAVIGSTNVIAENYVKGFIIINATDPTAVPKILHKEFLVGDGLWWDRNLPFKPYLSNMMESYGVSYPTWDPVTKELVYIVAKYNVGFDLIRRYAGLVVYNSEGEVAYDFSSLEEVPPWVTQVYDEDWLEGMINEWGGFRRGEAFDYWAGGFLWFIAPSRERLEMSEDTRYIVDPETGDVIAMVMVHPIASERTLAGVFKATREGIFYYDYSKEKYISGITAEDVIEGKLPKPATGIYDAEMPLLYPVQIGEDTYRLAWYVPIYWREGTGRPDETIYLAGFAIIDAQDINIVSIEWAGEGLTSEQLVRLTRLNFIKLFGIITYVELDTTVSERYEYVADGTTYIALRTENTTYPWIEASAKDLPKQQWYELLATKAGDHIKARIEKRGDTWVIIDFDNLRI